MVLAGRLAWLRVLPVLTRAGRITLHGIVSSMFCGGLIFAASAAAAPSEYGSLPVDPNVLTDSTAYVAEPAVTDPGGQPGIEQTFTHRDGSRRITDTIWVLGDPRGAADALRTARSQLGGVLVEQSASPAPVGDDGTIVSGPSPDGSRWLSVLQFTRDDDAVQIRFDGSRADPVPVDLVVEYGQRQDDVIRQHLGR